MSTNKKLGLRVGTANPTSSPRRTDAPCNTEGGKQGCRSSPRPGSSRNNDHGEKIDTDEYDKEFDEQEKVAGGERVRRKELRVRLSRLGDFDRCEEEIARFDDYSTDAESVGSVSTFDSECTVASVASNRRRKHSSSDENGRASATSSKKKGRGRPPTTGQYIGLAEAKRKLVEAERREMELQAEREMSELSRDLRTPRLSESSESTIPTSVPCSTLETSSALGARITKAVETIIGVRNKSKNLSGPMMKALSEAVIAIQDASERLLVRSSTAETRALEGENARLLREVAELREDITSMRRQLAATSLKAQKLETELRMAREMPASPVHPPSTNNVEEMIRRAVAEVVEVTNARMSARFEGLESRLLPAPRLRPPLAADKAARKKITSDVTPPAVQMPAPRTTSEVCTLMPPANPAKTKALKKGRNTKEKKTAEVETTSSRNKKNTGDGPWQTVTNKKGKRAANNTKQPSRKEKKKKEKPKTASIKRRPPKLRTPQSSAVVMQIQPEAAERGVTYADVLSKAKARIRLSEHGIGPLEMKKSATGARLLVLPGAATGEKADTLAKLLREEIGDDVIKVSRPVRCVGVRISGLDDHSTKECVIAALAEAGSVPPEHIRSGEIGRLAGIGTVILQCPVEAAKRIVEKGRLLVGWVSARVKLLDARPLRCFKCLEAGHTAAVCHSEVDRSGLCFRCGEAGHRAVACPAKSPKCSVCTAAGRPSGHKLGGGACVAPARPRIRGGKKKKSGDGPRASSSTSSPATGVSNAAGAGDAPVEPMVTDGCPDGTGSAGGAPTVRETSVTGQEKGPRVDDRGI